MIATIPIPRTMGGAQPSDPRWSTAFRRDRLSLAGPAEAGTPTPESADPRWSTAFRRNQLPLAGPAEAGTPTSDPYAPAGMVA